MKWKNLEQKNLLMVRVKTHAHGSQQLHTIQTRVSHDNPIHYPFYTVRHSEAVAVVYLQCLSSQWVQVEGLRNISVYS